MDTPASRIDDPAPYLSGDIDLHAHTNESDGTLSPSELVVLAQRIGLQALAVTDHDTFAGYEKALPYARELGLDLVRGIELNSRLYLDGESQPRYAHLLGYFGRGEPTAAFREWLEGEQAERRSRNAKLAEALQAQGIEVTTEEVEARGRSLAGRPHFARLLVEKGYARNHEDAFRRYLGEEAPTYVQRQSQTTEEAIRMIRAGNGLPVIAHPIRLSLSREQERVVLERLKTAGLGGLEIYHSEHPPELQAHYRQLSEELGLVPTGGSDFHGGVKPDIALGTGRNGNIRVPAEFLHRLRNEPNHS